MDNPPGQLPPAPPTPTAPVAPTQIVGQQTAPSTPVPVMPPGAQISTVGPGHMNSMAVISLITAIVAPLGHLVGVGGLALIITSLVTGHMARSQIKKTGEDGMALALAGLIISYVHLALSILAVIFFIGLILAFIGAILHVASG